MPKCMAEIHGLDCNQFSPCRKFIVYRRLGTVLERIHTETMAAPGQQSPRLDLQLSLADSRAVDDLVQIDHLCFGKLWNADQYAREIESPNSDLLILKPTQPDPSLPSIVAYGCLWAILDEAHITILAVHPDYRGCGLGHLILWGLLSLAHRRQLKHATLEVRVSNTIAIGLYEKWGFQEAGRRKKYYSDTQEDALVLWCGGLQSPAFRDRLDRAKSDFQSQCGSHNIQVTVSFDTLFSG